LVGLWSPIVCLISKTSQQTGRGDDGGEGIYFVWQWLASATDEADKGKKGGEKVVVFCKVAAGGGLNESPRG
jgi:hypothetical protein